MPSITPNSLLAVLIPIVVIVLLLSSYLLLWSILRLPLRLGSCRLILWRITSDHAAVGQVFSDLSRCLPLSPLILRILLIVLILQLGVVLTQPIVILGVLRLALLSFLITIVIEGITSTALGGV